jgi:hypothetical protein
MMRWLIGLSALLFISMAHANQNSCPQKRWHYQGTVVSQGYFTSSESCFMTVRAFNSTGLVYRDFLFTSRGMMMVFNSFGDGPSSTDTGASEFYFSPLTHQLAVDFVDDLVIITMANGSKISFDAQKAFPLEMDGADLLVDPVVRAGNQGGVSILRFEGLRIELGFQMGMSPSWYLNRQARVIDQDGRVCSLRNSEIFVKKNDEIYHRYPTNDGLRNFLRRRCSDLTLW